MWMAELFTEFAAGLLTVRICRPERRNALSRSLIAALGSAFRESAQRDDVVAAILTGEGRKAFCAGGDLEELLNVQGPDAASRFATDARSALDEIRRFPVPVVAVLNGDALGGGAELALACDVRIAAAHARIGFLQSSLNITTGWGGGTDLYNLLPLGQATCLLSTAEVLPAQRAERIGLIDLVMPSGEEEEPFSRAWIARFAARKVPVMRAIKRLALLKRLGGSSTEWSRVETEAFTQTWVHEDHWAAVAAFLGRKQE
jgi:enoyl-CoA hydratase